MEVRIEEIDLGNKIVYLSGELNTNTAKQVEDELDDGIADDDIAVLDFDKVPYVSSAGIRVLMKLIRRMRNIGKLSIINLDVAIYEIFKVVNLTSLIEITVKGNADVSSGSSEIEFEDYSLTEDEAEMLSTDVRYFLEEGKAEALLATKDGAKNGFIIYDTARENSTVMLRYIYVVDEKNDGGPAEIMKAFSKRMSSEGVTRIQAIARSEAETKMLGSRLNFRKQDKSERVMTYSIKQILESKLYSKIEKLRPMYDKIKTQAELEYMQQMEADMLLGDDAEEMDPTFARFFVINDSVLGALHAVEVSEGNIWIKKISVKPSPETKMAIPLMLASMFDASCMMLEETDEINIICDNDNLYKAYDGALGAPKKEVCMDYYEKDI